MDVTLKERAEKELGRFFRLAADGVENLTMISGFIDEVWHEMLDEHDKYNAFCKDTAGALHDHIPGEGEGVITWVDAYEAKFGQLLDPLWFTDATGNLDVEAYEGYLKARGFKASWKCTPLDPSRQAQEIKASWKCTPLDPSRQAQEIRASWKCTPLDPSRQAQEIESHANVLCY